MTAEELQKYAAVLMHRASENEDKAHTNEGILMARHTAIAGALMQVAAEIAKLRQTLENK